MLKLGKTLYNKIKLQVEEAREFGLDKLASDYEDLLKSPPGDDNDRSTSYSELENDVEDNVRELVLKIAEYHKVDSVYIENLDKFVSDLASQLIYETEEFYDVTDNLDTREPVTPGEE